MPDMPKWTEKAAALRQVARGETDDLARRTLLQLAADCDELASQQPGKPAPPGNPNERPDPDRKQPVREPPGPMPAPPVEPPPAPMQARK